MKLKEAFVTEAKDILSNFPDIVHEWSEDGSKTTIKFPKQVADGFDIYVEAEDAQITVFGIGAHHHFEPTEDVVSTAKSSLGFVRDLLGPDMRVRERWAGDTPYCWFFEMKDGKTWKKIESTYRLWWNFFARRSERIYTNRTLPGRSGAV